MMSKLLAKDFILLLLDSNGKKEIRGRLNFQKEMFLIVKEICPDLDNDLNFELCDCGHYSNKLDSLLEYLKKDSLINIKHEGKTIIYSIAEKGADEISDLNVSKHILKKIGNLKFNSDKLGYKGLLRYVYFNYESSV